MSARPHSGDPSDGPCQPPTAAVPTDPCHVAKAPNPARQQRVWNLKKEKKKKKNVKTRGDTRTVLGLAKSIERVKYEKPPD